jgi:putative ABC transport system substrate-binding protein
VWLSSGIRKVRPKSSSSTGAGRGSGSAFGNPVAGYHGSKTDVQGGFAAATKNGADALLTLGTPLTLGVRKPIAELAIKDRLPSMFDSVQFVDAGGLLSYGPSFSDLYRRSAAYVDTILKGAKPADLPVEQPTKFELVINLKTAKQIGLRMPNVLARADRVIR